MRVSTLDVWLLDDASGVAQRFTFEAANKFNPVWSPDSRRVVYSWDVAGVPDLYVKPVDGAGNGTLLWSSSEPKGATGLVPGRSFHPLWKR